MGRKEKIKIKKGNWRGGEGGRRKKERKKGRKRGEKEQERGEGRGRKGKREHSEPGCERPSYLSSKIDSEGSLTQGKIPVKKSQRIKIVLYCIGTGPSPGTE